jgi:hypothetical protein
MGKMDNIQIRERIAQRIDELNKIMLLMDVGSLKSIDAYKDEEINESELSSISFLIANLVTGEIIRNHLQVEEAINMLIAFYYFPGGSKEAAASRRNLRYSILDYVPVDKKIRMVNEIKDPTIDLGANLNELNNIRVMAAHAFFPEAHTRWKKMKYKGKDIFTYLGIRSYKEDASKVVNSLVKIIDGYFDLYKK